MQKRKEIIYMEKILSLHFIYFVWINGTHWEVLYSLNGILYSRQSTYEQGVSGVLLEWEWCVHIF